MVISFNKLQSALPYMFCIIHAINTRDNNYLTNYCLVHLNFPLSVIYKSPEHKSPECILQYLPFVNTVSCCLSAPSGDAPNTIRGGARLLLGIYSGIATLDQSTQHFCEVRIFCETVALHYSTPRAMEVPT